MQLVNHKIGVNPDIQKYQPRVFEKVPELVRGTSFHDEYWEQERLRCIEGYEPKGMSRITGPHYFFLNYFPMKINDPTSTARHDRKVLGLPFYRDMDHMYFKTVEECKDDRNGLITAKSRDKGFSMFNSCLSTHEATFFPHNEIGIAAGLDDTIVSFANKIRLAHNSLVPEFRNNLLKNNDDMIKMAFDWWNRGQWEEAGLQTMIHLRTMGLNPNVFKGERLALMIFEEAGEFKKLIEGFQASEPCFRDGADQFGLPIVGGTGGNILNASADFKTMWYEHESFNLRQLFIPVTMCYKGFFDFTTGTSLERGAREEEEKKRKKLSGGSQLKYNLHIQNYPFTPEESFLRSSGSPFNLMKINEQRKKILSDSYLQYRVERGWLDFVDDEISPVDGKPRRFNKLLFKQKLKWRKDPNGPIQILLHPIWKDESKEEHMYMNLDIGGIDSIDQDEAGASDSEGAVVIYRRFVNVDLPHNLPVAILKFRSNRAVEFYELALKMAIYYNCKMLVEYTKIGIIDYFKANGGARYLKEKPRSVHSPDTKTRNQYGVHMNTQIKETGIELMADDIQDYVQENWFIELLDELADFGTRNTDLAMAYMMCVIHNFDTTRITVRKEADKEEEEYNWGEWKTVILVVSKL